MTAYASRVYRLIFAAAAAYNILFGLWAALFPRAFFSLFQLHQPEYPGIWACLGMVIGLYGVGYAYAASKLDRGFVFIAIGLAGKILGPIGWVMSVRNGELPLRTFPLIVFDDLLWWTPFAMFLLEGTRVTVALKRAAPYLCAAMHVIAAIATVTLMRNPDEARLGWVLWMLAAISLAGFYAWWGARLPMNVALIAFSIASIGLLFDFAGESIFIGWNPRSRIAWLLSGAAGNGFYTIAGILLTIASRNANPLAWVAWISGIALSIATIANSQIAITISSAVLMISFIPFVILMGRKLA